MVFFKSYLFLVLCTLNIMEKANSFFGGDIAANSSDVTGENGNRSTSIKSPKQYGEQK